MRDSLLEKEAVIWDYYKPRHTHAWNMLVIAWNDLETFTEWQSKFFECEYRWESFIIRLWLYRTTVKTLTKLATVTTEAKEAIKQFDAAFMIDGRNALKAMRDMIEHFDDYASGAGRGPVERTSDLDPWRTVTPEQWERGHFKLGRRASFEAACRLRDDAKCISDKFVQTYTGQT